MSGSHVLARVVCADPRLQGVLHRLCDALGTALDKRQFTMLGSVSVFDDPVPFGHRAEVRRAVVDGIEVDQGSSRQLQLRVAFSFYSSGPFAGRCVLSVELRDGAFLNRRTGSPQGSAAFFNVFSLPTLGPVDANSTEADPHVLRVLETVENLDRDWLARTAQSACDALCAALAP